MQKVRFFGGRISLAEGRIASTSRLQMPARESGSIRKLILERTSAMDDSISGRVKAFVCISKCAEMAAITFSWLRWVNNSEGRRLWREDAMESCFGNR